ncbi:hypothetical protein M0R45_032794 [Rubus argutus]|uniref:Glycine-rich protein n=1 Tax=Rubus argutus TaxID=59490 RepID=A0AAW1WI59_RUBAR
MGSNKAFLLLALLVALVLVVAASRDLAQTSTEKENGEASDVGGLDDAKYGGYGGPGGGYQGRNGGPGGGYQGGNGGPGGGYQGGGGGGGCYHGCCRRNDYGRGCRRCCNYAGEAVDSAEP